MTRSDYELLALVLRENEADVPLIEAFGRALKIDNPRFDQKRFLEAAGGFPCP